MIKNKIIFASVILIATLIGSNAMALSNLDWVLPNSKVTPGSINSDVTQSNIQSTICVSGWTTTVRPKTSYTNNLKKQQLSGDYKYLIIDYGSNLTNYEEDHLISLELGGNPSDPKNLWTQPWSGNNARQKDVIETKLKKLVCSGTIKLSVAQKAIASNWVKAYNKYKKY